MSTKELLTRLESVQPVIERRALYLEGRQPLRFLVDRVDPKVMGFKSNLARVAVRAVAGRIRLDDVQVSVDGRDVSERARRLVRDADVPMVLGSVITEMLGLGSAYLIVWADEFGRPTITGESATQVAVERDPITRAVSSAVKRWVVRDANGVEQAEHVVVYDRSRIVHLVRDRRDAKLVFKGAVDNPLGVVPVVPLINIERIHDDVGHSVVDDLAPLLDALNKLFVDLLTASESAARPKRFATGVALEDDPVGFTADEGFVADDVDTVLDDLEGQDHVRAPFKDSDDMWVSEQAEAKFGQLAGADLKGYQTAVDLVVQQIMAVSSLPAHMVGITTANPSTAEALRASEVALADEAASRVRVVSRPVEWAVRLLVAIDQGVSPDRVSVDLTWADTSTRSPGADADAAVKLHAEGIVDDEQAQAKVGAGKEL